MLEDDVHVPAAGELADVLAEIEILADTDAPGMLPTDETIRREEELRGCIGFIEPRGAMKALESTLYKTGPNGKAILGQTVSAIRVSMESGLRIVFIIGAIMMLLTFLIICTIPQISIDAQVEDKRCE